MSSFGPLLLAKVLGLNETQTSVLALVFKFCDDRDLELLDFADLRAVLQHLDRRGRGRAQGLRRHVEADGRRAAAQDGRAGAQGGQVFFGEPEFDLDDLLQAGARRPRRW